MVVAIKSKGGDCWHYDSSVVLDGNSLRGWYRCSEVGTSDGNLIRRQILVQHGKKVHTRRFVKPKSRVHAGWLQQKRVYVEKYLWSMAVSPWKLCLWFRTIVSRRACRSLVLKLMVLCCYGFGSWYCEGPKAIEGEDH